jgi:hypothetical protein
MCAVCISSGGLWQQGALVGKPAGIFVSTATQGGGQETTALTFVTQLTHHGMLFVPIGYSSPLSFNMVRATTLLMLIQMTTVYHEFLVSYSCVKLCASVVSRSVELDRVALAQAIVAAAVAAPPHCAAQVATACTLSTVARCTACSVTYQTQRCSLFMRQHHLYPTPYSTGSHSCIQICYLYTLHFCTTGRDPRRQRLRCRHLRRRGRLQAAIRA